MLRVEFSLSPKVSFVSYFFLEDKYRRRESKFTIFPVLQKYVHTYISYVSRYIPPFYNTAAAL